ncbi:MAG: efflux RND transporter periplasmic adaptor subunit [Hyphomicrobiales bacterium]|nr:efflux RND transporter periplasmic adaptor subunit [Hyphomicrobiales bacterium]
MEDRPLAAGASRPVPNAFTLPRRTQLMIVGGVALAAALAAVLVPYNIVQPYAVPRALPPQPLRHGTFRPTDEQWLNIKTGQVREVAFRTEHRTDGKIAIDDDQTTPVFSPFSGRVTRIFAKPGDEVDEGAPLFAIEAFEFVDAQRDLLGAAANLDVARTRLKLAETAEQSLHQAYDSKSGELKDWRQAQLDLALAQAGLRGAEAALAAARDRLRIFGKSDKDIDALESNSDAQQLKAETIVSAPVPGTVTDRDVAIGQYIKSVGTASQPKPQFTIADLSSVLLVANVRESAVPLIKKGQVLEVHVPAYPGRTFRGKVNFIAPSLDPTTHRLQVQAEVENPDGALKPEMFAEFNIITADEEKALAAPQDSVVYEGEYARVWVARGDKLLELRQIRTGRTNGDLVEVIGGLKAGDTVVTNGAVFIDRAVSSLNDFASRE